MGSILSGMAAGPGTYGYVPMHAAYLTSINVTLWLLSLRLGKTWPVDFVWSTWPIIQGLFLTAHAGIISAPRNALVMTAVGFWGLRLTSNFISRNGIGYEDWRYTEMREQQGRYFWIGSLFTVFLIQSSFMFAGCLPFYPALLTDVPMGYTLTGTAMMATGTMIELIADRQMDTFLAEQKNLQSTTRAVMDQGLWSCSRHPNYFGEWFFWLGVWTASGAQPYSYTSWGPGIMTGLFLGISVGMMEERQLKRRGDAFRDYQRRVPSSFFLVPPVLQHALLGAKKK